MRYTRVTCTPVRYTPMKYPAHHCFGGSLAQTVVDLSRSEFQIRVFALVTGWPLLPSRLSQDHAITGFPGNLYKVRGREFRSMTHVLEYAISFKFFVPQ